MNHRHWTVVLVAALSLGACKETPQNTAHDVAAARKDAGEKLEQAHADQNAAAGASAEDVAAAQKAYVKTDEAARAELSAAELEAAKARANAALDVAVVQAEGRRKIAKEKCDPLSGIQRDDCVRNADAAYVAEEARAQADKAATIAAASRQE